MTVLALRIRNRQGCIPPFPGRAGALRLPAVIPQEGCIRPLKLWQGGAV